MTQGQTASHKSPYTPRHDATVFGGGERGHLRPYAKVGTLMERVRHFCWLGGWSGDLGRENPSERRRRDHGSDGRARSGRRAARGRPGGVVGWPKRRPARGPLGVPRVVLRVSSGRSPGPRDPKPPELELCLTRKLSTSLGRLDGVIERAEGRGDPLRHRVHHVLAEARSLALAVPEVAVVAVGRRPI